MKPKMIWANLAVSNLGRTKEFYTKLGFESNGTHGSDELVSFSIGQDSFAINFFRGDVFSTNLNANVAEAHTVTEVVFTLSAESREQADDWEKEVEKAGGQIISRPEEFGEGYYGFLFADPDGHRFNVFYMKGF
ncbi:VOC family protein [Parapedobacter koreensis]|uniref:VOC domain-containing protein n=1 Tax=Parapedobacter koreensis TaxID=332977 RepID=A0A1H7T4U6_9SPHI|nr:VOC family protein [Parapedobacter koreensis]SEL79823.1 hypothetical protein SAMN05421740_11089 [Parapedobacter koreensis]